MRQLLLTVATALAAATVLGPVITAALAGSAGAATQIRVTEINCTAGLNIATCKVTTDVPTKVTLAIGLDRINTISLTDNRSRPSHRITLKSLAPGTTYMPTFTFTDKKGNLRVVKYKPFKTLPAGTSATLTVRNGKFLLNGIPSFIWIAQSNKCLTQTTVDQVTTVGVIALEGFASLCNLGQDPVQHIKNISEILLDKAWWLEEAERNLFDPNVASLPQLLGWSWGIDPETYLRASQMTTPVGNTPSFLAMQYSWWGGESVPWDGEGASPGLWSQTYKSYLAKTDAVIWDWQPYMGKCSKDTYADLQDSLNRIINTGVAAMYAMYLTTKWAPQCGAALNTPANVRAQFWVAVVAGAVGIEYYTQPSGTNVRAFDVDSDIKSQAILQHKQLTTLAPCLLAGSVVRATSSLASVQVRACRYGGTTYLVAINTNKAAAKTTISAAGLGSSAQVMWENRNLKLKAGTITDSFGPTAVHIYKVAAPATP